MSLGTITYLQGAMLLFAGVAAGFGASYWRHRGRRLAAEREGRASQDTARREAEALVRESRLAANEESLKIRSQSDHYVAARRSDLDLLEQRLTQRESLINRQLEGLVEQETSVREQMLRLQTKGTELEDQRQELDRLIASRRTELQRLAHLTEAEARAVFLKEVEQEAMQDAADLNRHILENAKANAEAQARRIVSLAIQRYAGEHCFETTTATVALQGDDIKGRIIGREGRNIRAFEAATGVTVLIDDTPNAVVLSAFDPVRREIAREAMERLILDGRIHPTRIEEVVAKVSQEVDETIRRVGEEAVLKVGLPPFPVEMASMLGRLHFRHSFSQNILAHSIEVAQLCGLMAAELGADIATAKRAGLLHDIGKALDHEIEGAHALIGADWLRRFGESEEVVEGVASHHDEVPHKGLIGILVSAADAVSASRPGARSETMTTYLKRLENLERIGLSFPGVDKCFAVQAGRELRVVVQPDQIGDEQAQVLARNIVRRIENDLQYPGQIRVTVVREKRCVEFAK